ncbi:MAG TPA: ABC transporter permease [Vicinamibacterales bacterium]
MPDQRRDAHESGPDLPRASRLARANRRFVWWLVWLYPPAFRRELGLGLADALEDQMRARLASGAGGATTRTRAVIDTVRNAAAEWTDAFRSAYRSYTAHRSRAADLSHSAHLSYTADPSHFADAKGRSMIDKLSQDVRYALRLWRRRPGFALVAILTLALGIGANTAMFTIVNAVLLRPLPYAHADRLVAIWGQTQAFRRGLISYNEYEEIAKQSGTLDAAALWLSQSVNLTDVEEPQRLLGMFATGSYFDVLGLAAERGRLFSESESGPGHAAPVVVISDLTWRRRFASNPDVVGRKMTLNGMPLTIVGVLAPTPDADTVPDTMFFAGDVFLPAGLFPTPGGLRAAGPVMLGLARLKAGVPLASGLADLDVLGRRLIAADPNAQAGRTLTSEPLGESIVGGSRPALVLLLAAVATVLLIACVNVSHLLLARAIDRQKEIALRTALGAARGAVVRQLAVEAALMALTAAAAGLVLGKWAIAALLWLQPPATVPIPARLPLDGTVLLFTGGLTLLVALLCGLAPAIKVARPDISRALQAGSNRASSGGRRTRDVLMVVEMTLSVALVAVSALLIQSLLAVQRAPIGFDPDNVFTLQLRLPQSKYPKPEDIAKFFKSAIERVREVPGVQSAALVRAVPFSGNGGMTGYVVEGRPQPDAASMPQARFHLVTPEYFKTMRIPLLKGRDFTDRDDLAAPLVAVINETFARRVWPDEDAIGKRITTPNTSSPLTIVGIVGDAKHYTATEPAAPQLYIAHYQVPLIFTSLVARTAADPMSIANGVRRAIWSVDKDQPVWTVRSLASQLEATQGSSRFLAGLLGVFAAIALVLAGVGIYGVMSYGVAQQTHEIGIRLALGASGERVLREIVGRSVRLTLAAVGLGLLCAVGIGRLASAMLFGVGPTDATALTAAGAVLAVVSLAATYLPARRASRVDPVVALAEE